MGNYICCENTKIEINMCGIKNYAEGINGIISGYEAHKIELQETIDKAKKSGYWTKHNDDMETELIMVNKFIESLENIFEDEC